MAADGQALDLTQIEIVPLQAKTQLKGAFQNEPKGKFDHLKNYLICNAWKAQEEKKSRTYIMMLDGIVIGYFTVSTAPIKFPVPGTSNETKFEAQGLMLGKLMIAKANRGTGIGVYALSYVYDLAGAMNDLTGCAGVVVHSHEDALEFYEKVGFEHVQSDEGEDLLFFKLI